MQEKSSLECSQQRHGGKERKGNRKKVNEAVVWSASVSQVHHRRNAPCCDDSTINKTRRCGHGHDFTYYLSSPSHNHVLFDKLMPCTL